MLKKISAKNAQVIAISSGKGGVGKSNIAVNLSITLAQASFKVCLFDADINLANINILLGLNPPYTMQHLFSDNKSIDDIIMTTPTGFDLIAGASGVSEFINFNPQQQQYLLKSLLQLEQNYDYLIIDTAAGIEDTVLTFLHAVPYLILVLTKEPTSLTDAFSLLKILKKQDFHGTVLVVINMVSGIKMARHIFNRFSEAVKQYIQLEVHLAGYIVMDPCVSNAVEKQQPFSTLFPECPASSCMNNLTQRLIKGLKNNKLTKHSFSNYFANIIFDNTANDVNAELLSKIKALNSIDANNLFEHLKRQLQITEPATRDVITENSNRSQLKSLPKEDYRQYISNGLKKALFLAAKLK